MWSPTSPDALPLSYRKLVETEATTLGSCDKHPTYCCHWNVDRAICVWLWRMVSISVRYLFYQLMDEKIKTWTLRFPDKENPNMEKTLLNWPIVLQYDVKAKYRLIFGKFSGMKFFHPSVRLTNQNPREVCIRSMNQSNVSFSVRLLFLFRSRVFISRSYENRSICLCAMIEMCCFSLIN